MDGNLQIERVKQTDYEVLQLSFGDEYYVLPQITKNKIELSKQQIQFLEALIDERDHYDIAGFVHKLRSQESNTSKISLTI